MFGPSVPKPSSTKHKKPAPHSLEPSEGGTPAGWVLVAHEKFHDLVINKLQMFNDYVTMSQITIGLCSLGDGEFFGNVDTLW